MMRSSTAPSCCLIDASRLGDGEVSGDATLESAMLNEVRLMMRMNYSRANDCRETRRFDETEKEKLRVDSAFNSRLDNGPSDFVMRKLQSFKL